MTISLPVPNKITTPPAVMLFDENNYTVLWATSRPSTGTLVVITDGKKQLFHDAAAGVIRHNDKLHSVRIAKDILDRCDSYYVQSRAVVYHTGYVALKGQRAKSKHYHFQGYRGQAAIHALFCTDIHGKQRWAVKNAKALQQQASSAPDFIILGGDIPHDGLHTRRSFTKGVLGLCAKLGGSERPVLYARGNHETRGQWASELMRYTGNLYFAASYGPISFVVLDSGEDKPDHHPEYSGLADFSTYHAKQFAWLCKQNPSDLAYRVAICHQHVLDERWYPQLRRLGISDIFVGHEHNCRSWVHADISHYEDGGPNTASWLLFSGGKIVTTSAEAI